MTLNVDQSPVGVLRADAASRLTRGQIAYLHPAVKFEPLVHGWHAWLHLLSPLTHAMNIEYRHVPLLRSFITSPAIHVSACANADAADGRFVDLPVEAVPRISELMAATAEGARRATALARAFKALDDCVQSRADGHGLENLYREVPDCLGGLVELVYDLNNHCRVRFAEELASSAADDALVETIAISDFDERNRKFFLTTPRLLGPSDSVAKMCFADKRLDLLAKARISGVDAAELLECFETLDKESADCLLRNVTAEAPQARQIEDGGDEVSVHYFGHACVLVSFAGTNIMLDPLIAWGRGADGNYALGDIPDLLDAVVITHGHHDHFCVETLLQIRHRTGSVAVPVANSGSAVDPSMKLALARLGFANVRALDPLESMRVGAATVTALPFRGEHADLEVYAKQGVMLEIGGRRLVFLADSNTHDPELYVRLRERFGRPDALFLGMECFGAPLSWLYGPLLTRPIKRSEDESRRLSASDAAAAMAVVEAMQPGRVFVYAMGQEPWLSHYMGFRYAGDSPQILEVQKFLELCNCRGIAVRNLVGSQSLTFR